MKRLIILISHKKKLIHDSLTDFLCAKLGAIHLPDTDSTQDYNLVSHDKPLIIVVEIESSALSTVSYYLRKYQAAEIIGLFDSTKPLLIKQFFRMGGKGIMTLDSPLSELISCIKAVASGERFFCTSIKENLLKENMEKTLIGDRLTRREMEILSVISEGKST